ncbi:hypothetical protein CKAN_02618500 [Cinnamomum micranthum f. kanehirae]|uniref:DUF674 domain-containing protein n=1 Tax=Cinnamomum micranthum f. kanehirae TaxID=337451 RepID=A0A443Q176_9MAGN|nr:hypothetical protein CKAN_02618500 [Cinnamomum micranthum f. kanehirae]
MATTLMSLKLFVNKEMNRVVFAESGNDFVDVLLSFLTLPIGTIIGLTGKQSKMRSMSRLYESVEDLDVNLLQAEACKDMLLHPRSASEEQCKNLKMNQDICKKPPKVVAEGKDGVFVKGDVIYMISDDLQVFPASTASALSLFKDLGIGLRTTFEEHNVRVSAEEVLHLLERLLFSKTPLTDTFLREQDMASTADHNSIATLNSSGHGMAQSQMEGENDISSKRMSIKLIQNKSNHRIFYAETGTDFPDLLFSFLTFPLGAILKCLGGRSGIKSLDNLYKSIEDLNSKSSMKSEECKTLLLDPKLAPYFNSKNQLLQIEEEAPRNFLIKKCQICFNSDRLECSHGLGSIMVHPINPKYPGAVTESGGAFLKEPTTFIVTDNLVVKPFSTISVITLLSSYNIVMNDIEERDVNVGVLEAISLLKASLISNTVLNDVFSPGNPIPNKIGYYRRMVASTINKAIEDGILHEDNYSNN